MSHLIERRNFLGLAITLVGARIHPDSFVVRDPEFSASTPNPGIASVSSASFPQQDVGMVQEMVAVSHSNLARVKELLNAHPALAKAAVDWGFGDWEDALGAASHTGRAEIAELLLARGARPTIFSAAMLGQLETVKTFVATTPGCQRTLGPHGITLLSHAKAGGERAKATLAYLEQLGDADVPAASVPLDPAKRDPYVGTYAYGATDKEVVNVALNGAAGLTITRPGLPAPRGLRHLGNHEFAPAGAEFVRIRFTVADGKATKIDVFDPELTMSGVRQG